MTRRIQMARLRARHGLTFSQAMFITKLAFGPDHEDIARRWKGPLIREGRE